MCYNFAEKKWKKGRKMKRILSLLLTLGMLISMPLCLAACKSEESSKKKKKNMSPKLTMTESLPETETETQTAVMTETEGPAETPKETESQESKDPTFGKETTEAPTSTMEGPVETIGPHEAPEYSYQEVTFDPVEISNRDGLTITATGYKMGMGTIRTLTLHIENKSGHTVRINSEMIAVEDFQLLPMYLIDVEDQATVDEDYEFFLTLGDEIGLWNPGKIDLIFSVEYKDNGERYFTERASIRTNLYDENKTYDFSYAAPIFKNDDILISALDYRMTDYNAELVLLLENNSDRTLRVEKETVYVNGIDILCTMICTLEPGNKSVYTLDISKTRLQDAAIKKVETISLQLYYAEKDDYKNKNLCDPVNIKVG